MSEAIEICLAGPAGKLIKPELELAGERPFPEQERGIACPLRGGSELVTRDPHQGPLVAIEERSRGGVSHAELLADLFVEVLEEVPLRLGHPFVDLEAQLELELLESVPDLVRFPASLVDVVNPLLEIDSGADR